MERVGTVDWGQFEAVLFDLDGVLTATAQVHARCWKQVFDEYLLSSTASDQNASRPFELPQDYTCYVDGKPRYDGVRSFLSSRGVWLPDGTPVDLPIADTVCGLGNKKSFLFTEVIQAEGIAVYPDAVSLAKYLRKRDIKLGVVSSSRHCESVLTAAGLQDYFSVRVDGVIAEKVGLAGKPSPETFVYASRELGVEPSGSAVIEDALVGVRAAKQGGFGLVVGIDRTEGEIDLSKSGADLVVTDLEKTLGIDDNKPILSELGRPSHAE
tara:strand:- start:131 stop:934 length:804 start_codon:yes stop_codon:yes gene_type:complete